MIAAHVSLNKFKSLQRRLLNSKALARFIREDEEGVAAIEFAMIAGPFFAIVFFIIQSGYMFWVSSTLDTGVKEASRLIKTGQVQEKGMTKNEFRNYVCSLSAMPEAECRSKLVLEVESFPGFQDITRQAPMKNGSLDNSVSKFKPGTGREIVFVKAYLPMPSLDWIHKLVNGSSDGNFVLTSTAAFRNEPF